MRLTRLLLLVVLLLGSAACTGSADRPDGGRGDAAPSAASTPAGAAPTASGRPPLAEARGPREVAGGSAAPPRTTAEELCTQLSAGVDVPTLLQRLQDTGASAAAARRALEEAPARACPAQADVVDEALQRQQSPAAGAG